MVYRMFVQYFRQCIQHPPPNFQSQSQQFGPSHSGGTKAALRHSVPSSSTSNTTRSRTYAPKRNSDVDKLNVLLPEGHSTPDACHLPPNTVQSRQVAHDSFLKKSFSVPMDKDKRQRDSAIHVNDLENSRVDIVTSDLIRSQKIIDSAEELSNLEDRKGKSPEPVNNHVDLVYHCEWTTSRDCCQDSGCMSDRSSGGGDSPSTTASPRQSVMNDCTANEVSDDEYSFCLLYTSPSPRD